MNTGLIAGIIIAAVFVGFVLWRLSARKAKKAANAWKENSFDRAMKIINSISPVLTPEGRKVYFETGTDRATFSLPACDAGVNKTFEKAECVPYPVIRGQHDIKIVVFLSEPDSQGDPAFKVYINNQNYYWNSEWDKATCPGDECDHYVLAAGQTIAKGQPYGDVIVIPHHSGKEEHLARVVEYEMEHVVLGYYDGPKADATDNHASGTGHPLIPDCPSDIPRLMTRPLHGLCMGATK